MKKVFATASALVAFVAVGAAGAADLPAAPVYKAPVVAPEVWSWTGFYIGINGGGTRVKDDLAAAPADAGTTAFWGPCFAAGACSRDFGSATGTAAEFGGQAGFNWQFNSLVAGLETDFQWTNATSSSSVALANTGIGFVPFNGQASSELRWFGTTRGRLGVLAAPSVLLYGTGGVAYGSINRSWAGNFPTTLQNVSGINTQNAVGWTAGGGIEWMPTHNWTFGVEYLHVQYESSSFPATGFGNGAGCASTNCNFTVSSSGLTQDIVRAKLNYLFNWGGPVVARY
jgi:outer membrane immunogenic protein